MSIDCELCRLCNGDVKTKLYYGNADFLIVNCLTCGENNPMLVFRKHGPASKELSRLALNVIHQLFGHGVSIRTESRKIKDHAHWHIGTMG